MPDPMPDLDSTVSPDADAGPAFTMPVPAAEAEDTRTPEQIAKDERQEYLRNESLIAYGYTYEPGLEQYAPEFAIFLIVLGFSFIIFDKRKASGPKGWRSWLRGRV